MTILRSWHEAYRFLAKVLNETYLAKNEQARRVLFDKLGSSDFFQNSSFLNDDLVEEQKGIDPIQIFSLFNYSKIKKDSRLSIIRTLFQLLDTDVEIDSLINFEGIPSPVITRLVQFRNPNTQLEIWSVFHQAFTGGLTGLNETIFHSIEKWNGIDIPSFTMFLFWIDSDHFLPLDQNTLSFLRIYELISHRPKSYSSYKELIEKIEESSFKFQTDGDLLRSIVKDAYNFVDKTYTGNLISSATASVIEEGNSNSKSNEEVEKAASKKRRELFKNFEIIAIRPTAKPGLLGDLSKQKHLKNLMNGQLYQFYNSYSFDVENDKIINYSKEKEVNIFNLDGLNVSICAIVGMNGSGKSTLVELLYLIVNKISFEKNIESTEDIINEEVYADIFIKSDKLYKISVGEKVKLYEYEFNETESSYIQTTEPDQGEMNFDNFDIESFCYSLVINYSLYGLNSNIVGPWINSLFHKNDSYQVPIVLNPKRDDGVIDVNNEDSLAKSRLLANLLEPDLINFKDNYIPELVPNSTPDSLLLSLDEEKIKRKRAKYLEINGKAVSQENIEKVVREYNLIIHDGIEFETEALEYIYLKTISIAHSYSKFQDFINLPHWVDDKPKLRKYIDRLQSETSHITFKLRQAINYLRYGIYTTSNENSIIDLSSKILQRRSSGKSDKQIRTIDLVPPSFFKTNIKFKHSGKFDELSSGEKQQIYSINTIAYHLYNLKSVMVYQNTYKYSCVNIIFDEVELYFHPDRQRSYINNLLKRIALLRLDAEGDINNLNIMFITHSPFILSDIPKANVLRLEVSNEGMSTPNSPFKNTFASNIHELLADSFFLSSSIGEFAKEKINELLEFYRSLTLANGEQELKSLEAIYKIKKNLFYTIVDNVGEEFIKGILKNHLEFINEQFESTLTTDTAI